MEHVCQGAGLGKAAVAVDTKKCPSRAVQSVVRAPRRQGPTPQGEKWGVWARVGAKEGREGMLWSRYRVQEKACTVKWKSWVIASRRARRSID